MRRLATYIVAFLLLPPAVSGQTVRKDIPNLEFARFGNNRIIMQGDSSAFETVYRKLDSLIFEGRGNLRIMHIGGSHVQAGTLTRQLRNNLLALGDSLDGGRGLVFPFSAAKTNNPSSFRTRSGGTWTAARNVQKEPAARLGLTGAALTTADTSAFVRIVLKARNAAPDEPAFRFNNVNVIGYPSDGDMYPVIITKDCDTLTGIRDEEASCWSFDLPGERDSVTVAVGGKGGSLTLTGIFLDNQRPGISVTGIGVNGAALSSYAKCPDLERDLRMVEPDLVIFAIGINDAVAGNFSKEEFIGRYKAMVSRVRSVCPDCALLFVTNNDSYRRVRRRVYAVNPNGIAVQDAFFRLCADCGGGVWDLFDIMGGLGSMKDWEEAGLAKKDKIHFTEAGYSIVGDLLYNALMSKYMDHLRKRMAWD